MGQKFSTVLSTASVDEWAMLLRCRDRSSSLASPLPHNRPIRLGYRGCYLLTTHCNSRGWILPRCPRTRWGPRSRLAEVQGPHGGLVPARLPGARTWQASGLRRSASCRDRADAREHIGGPLGCRRPATDLAAPGAGKTGPRAATSRNTASPPPSYIAEDAIVMEDRGRAAVIGDPATRHRNPHGARSSPAASLGSAIKGLTDRDRVVRLG